MSLWEYKVITSGKGGFATPALLEKFLNELGRDEWEIVEFRSAPDNPLAFTGLARRSTQRDWTLQDAAAAAAKAEAEKLRAEFSAKFQAATANGPAVEEKSPSFLEEKIAPADDFRKPVDTSRDSDPDAPEEDTAEEDEWDQLAAEDELPTFFDALKPHMRRNQRGPGMSVGVDYLAKKWGLAEEDVRGALVECGMQIPADENAKPVYVEYDGDLFWVNINRRGEVWINTREKPRPVFRVVPAAKVAPETTEEPKPENRGEKTESVRHQRSETSAQQPELPIAAQPENRNTKPETGGRPSLPTGPVLLEKIRPLMRRNRRGPGGSGSTSFLARALKCSEADLIAGFAALGLKLPATSNDEPVELEIGGDLWWLNQDSRGGIWINGREKREGEIPKPAAADQPVSEGAAVAPTGTAIPAEAAPAQSPEEMTTAPMDLAAAGTSPLAKVRPVLKETRTGGFAGKIDRVAEELKQTPETLTATLMNAGLKIPEKPREKPVFVEHAGEIFWFNKNAKGELWVNAKASKFADGTSTGEGEPASGKQRPRRGGKTRKDDGASPADSEPRTE